MILDTRTVLYFEGFLFLVCFIVLFILWYQARNRFKGLALWSGFYLLESAGFLLMAFREYVPAWASIPFANSLIAGGFILLLIGSLLFIGKKVSPLLLTGLSVTFVAFIVVHTWFTFANPDLVARIFNVSIVMAIYCLLTYFYYQRTPITEIKAWSKGSRSALLVLVLILAARLFGIAQIETNNFMASGMYDTVMVLLSSLAVVFLAFTLVLMVARRSIEATIKTEEKYATLFEKSMHPVFIIDSDGNYIDANTAGLQFLECSYEELMGRSVWYSTPPELDREALLVRHRKLWQEGGTIEVDFLIGDQIKTLEQALTPGILDEKQVVFSLGRDITERKASEEREKKLQQELIAQSRLATVGEMAAGIAHEINNPLTGVIGFSSFLLERDLPEDIKQDIVMINEGSRRVASIIKRMLTFAGQQGTEFAATDLNELIDIVLEMRSHDNQLENIRIIKHLDPELPRVQVDAGQIQQVFLNIVINAEIEMSDAHGEGVLTITTERANGGVRITFEDTGPGIRKENVGKVFDPFFTTREVGRGTGLGLSVSYGIIANHRGNIRVDSEYGKGARFIIELPVKQSAVRLKEPEIMAEVVKPKTGKILVVDDEEIVRNVINGILRKNGYSVESVESGQDALALLEYNDYDAVLLDVRMPGISGIDIYEKLYNISPEKQKKVIFVTGDVMNQETMAYVLSTGIPYIGKPFVPEDIIKMIDKVIAVG